MGIHPFGAGENVEYHRVEPPSEEKRQADKELIEAVASPWICVEEKPCEETVAVHWEELITALSAAIADAQQRGSELQREAAMDAAAEAIRRLSIRSDKYPDRYVTAAAFKTRAECAIDAIRAAKQQ